MDTNKVLSLPELSQKSLKAPILQVSTHLPYSCQAVLHTHIHTHTPSYKTISHFFQQANPFINFFDKLLFLLGIFDHVFCQLM